MQSETSSQLEKVCSKHYDHTKLEKEWLTLWSEIASSSEHTHTPSKKGPFCLLLPPPNVTGSLHMGHALTTTIQDLIARFKKMLGYEVVWIPGADHAGIATQSVVDRTIRSEEGRSLQSLGRLEALSKLQSWSERNQQRIVEQLKRLGCFLTWKKFTFSMDSSANQAVRTAFKRAVDKGFIYKGNYLVNWDFGTGTALSDDEVTYEERTTVLVSIAYPVDETTIPIATTRPETMWGDVAIAVHPEDPRYSHLIGKTAKIPIVGREIPILADSRVLMEFGTGAVKITPGHDPLDYQIGLDHKLPMLLILDASGRLQDSGDMTGLTIAEARERMIQRLDEESFLLDKQKHTHRIGVSYRSGMPIEPILSKQWFFRLSAFTDELEEALEKGEIKLLPEGQWESTYKHWVRNLRDWCISRQLWWGHRIPVWYKKGTDEWICSDSQPEEVVLNPESWEQDEDVLDTWFSSALWPMTTLGWPQEQDEFAKFYPNQLCETGFDILFFWVTRMLVVCKFLTKQWPFQDIYLHGLIYAKSYWKESEGHISYIVGKERKAYETGIEPIPQDIQVKWEKMSKSKGNIMDPLELAEEYGTDAMRIALISLISESKQLDLDYRKFEEYRHFTNKLWHAARFVLKIISDVPASPALPRCNPEAFLLEDRWILSRWSRTVQKVYDSLTRYEFLSALHALSTFFWDDFCDYYIELAKPFLYQKQGTTQERQLKRGLIIHLFIAVLRLQHPFTPFITEELLKEIREAMLLTKETLYPLGEKCLLFEQNEKALCQASCLLTEYPSFEADFVEPDTESSFERIREVVRSIRKLRAEAKLHPSEEVPLFLDCWEENKEETSRIICSMIKTASLIYGAPSPDQKTTTALLGRSLLHLVLSEINPEEKKRLEKELRIIEREVGRLRLLTNDPHFIEKAPRSVLNKQLDTLSRLEDQKQILKKRFN
ncbi:valine--tRNA ligase [Candidatus Similichlamydia laticola]|uniref:Valine--tRNA ligase n=1 Tax=Candidatus Similichlamydia laticola TaxID=2170265 RepID=A0A369KCU7_9BACT|nr:valine--tRNA ligase [Candidatus Similichlamydia laticola]RDB31422.1 Valyl-tRNA synthetase [Candidatus Similichlamydia laticola]